MSIYESSRQPTLPSTVLENINTYIYALDNSKNLIKNYDSGKL